MHMSPTITKIKSLPPFFFTRTVTLVVCFADIKMHFAFWRNISYYNYKKEMQNYSPRSLPACSECAWKISGMCVQPCTLAGWCRLMESGFLILILFLSSPVFLPQSEIPDLEDADQPARTGLPGSKWTIKWSSLVDFLPVRYKSERELAVMFCDKEETNLVRCSICLIKTITRFSNYSVL